MTESLLWRAEQPDGYGAFREHVVSKATEVMDVRGKLSASTGRAGHIPKGLEIVEGFRGRGIRHVRKDCAGSWGFPM